MLHVQMCMIDNYHIIENAPNQQESEPNDFFKRQKIYKDVFHFFFARTKTQNRHICRDQSSKNTFNIYIYIY